VGKKATYDGPNVTGEGDVRGEPGESSFDNFRYHSRAELAEMKRKDGFLRGESDG
jgi:hypothetical protein